ncbi:MAG TPA: hypothetical protein VFY78_11325, partial [Gammaproteobacteria bacterium]|nr:hypothetical protein [Gammaproteobacteria bacterium]
KWFLSKAAVGCAIRTLAVRSETGHGAHDARYTTKPTTILRLGLTTKNICVHLRDAQGRANAARAGCARAAQFAFSCSFSNRTKHPHAL